MSEIRFLRHEDLRYIKNWIMKRLNTDSIYLERGFIVIPDGKRCYSRFIVTDGEKRYKIESNAEWFEENGEKSLYPFAILKAEPYKRNFAFDLVRELYINQKLRSGYEHGIIDSESFLRLTEFANESIDELVAKIEPNHNRRLGVLSLLLGFIVGATAYKISEYTPINLKDYVNFPEFVLFSTWFGGLMDKSVPAIRTYVDVKRRKKEMLKELIDVAYSIEAKLKS